MSQQNIILATRLALTLKNLKTEVEKQLSKAKDENYPFVHVLLADAKRRNKNVLLKIKKGALRHIGNGRKLSLKGFVSAKIFTKPRRSFVIKARPVRSKK